MLLGQLARHVQPVMDEVFPLLLLLLLHHLWLRHGRCTAMHHMHLWFSQCHTL
jgi:hypothetical protein